MVLVLVYLGLIVLVNQQKRNVTGIAKEQFISTGWINTFAFSYFFISANIYFISSKCFGV